MTRLILIRHGQSEANRNIWWAGITDAPLTERGRQQAEAAAAYLKEHEHIDAIYASPLSRATDTARPTAKAFGLPVIPDDDLREINGGVWEKLPFAELEIRYALDRAPWFTDLGAARCTEGETVRELFDRVVAAVRRIAVENDGKTVLIASHWTPVLCMLALAQGYGLENIRKCTEPRNASMQILRFENGVFLPERLNITEHLERVSGGCAK